MLADIVSGKTATADVFFLIAVIVFVLAAIAVWVRAVAAPVAVSLTALGGAFIALGFLVL